MNTFICEDATALGRAASIWCEQKIRETHARSLFVPAGNTPTVLYKVWENETPAYLNGVKLLQIDDVLTGTKRGLFKSFFRDHLPKHIQQIQFIEEAAAGADIAVLGLGLNGHIAFHEPEVHPSFFSGCVPLSHVTCENLGLEAGTWGISYGAEAFLAAKAILIMVSGASKQDVLNRLFRADPTLPASRLLQHANLTILADRAALGLITEDAPPPSPQI